MRNYIAVIIEAAPNDIQIVHDENRKLEDETYEPGMTHPTSRGQHSSIGPELE
jgi:hypothetical protein